MFCPCLGLLCQTNSVSVLSQALENDDAAPFSESDASSGSECESMSISDSNSKKDYPLLRIGEKKERQVGNIS